jgi:hypothetical protein
LLIFGSFRFFVRFFFFFVAENETDSRDDALLQGKSATHFRTGKFRNL